MPLSRRVRRLVLPLCAVLVAVPERGRADDAPAAPAAEPAPAAMTFLRIPVEIPLADLVSRVEAAVAGESGSAGFEPFAKADVDVSRGFEVQYLLRRDPVVATFQGDRIRLTNDVYYRLELRGPEIQPTGCGQDEPIRMTTGSTVRLGWSDDWTLGAQTHFEAVSFDERCKPKPPGINFTQFLGDAVFERVVRPVAEGAEREVAALTAVRSAIEEAWTVLQRPLLLPSGNKHLRWNPSVVHVDPIDVSDGVLHCNIGIGVAPEIADRDTPGKARAPLPPPNVRLFDDGLRIPMRFVVGWDAVAASLGDSLAARAKENGAGLEIDGVRAKPGPGGALIIEADVKGAFSGTLAASGMPVYDGRDFHLGVGPMEFTPESRADMAKASAAGPEVVAALAELPTWIRRCLRVSIEDPLLRQLQELGRAVNAGYGERAQMSGGVAERRFIGIETTVEGCIVTIEAVGKATLAVSGAPSGAP